MADRPGLQRRLGTFDAVAFVVAESVQKARDAAELVASRRQAITGARQSQPQEATA